MYASLPRVAPFIKNQRPRVFVTYSKTPYVQVQKRSNIKQYMYNLNDKNISETMYT